MSIKTIVLAVIVVALTGVVTVVYLNQNRPPEMAILGRSVEQRGRTIHTFSLGGEYAIRSIELRAAEPPAPTADDDQTGDTEEEDADPGVVWRVVALDEPVMLANFTLGRLGPWGGFDIEVRRFRDMVRGERYVLEIDAVGRSAEITFTHPDS
ncbi:MAG: hypothetical protein AAGI30_01225 [Planctomycetota bacterium]